MYLFETPQVGLAQLGCSVALKRSQVEIFSRSNSVNLFLSNLYGVCHRNGPDASP